MRGWQSIGSAFRIWADLMGGNYKEYGILEEDDSLTECFSWFWWSLGEDTVYSKEFLEYLIQLADDVKTGKVKTYSMDEVMEDLKGEH
jgi:hypothetical protein